MLEIEAPGDRAERPWWRQRWGTLVAGYVLAAGTGILFALWMQSEGDWTRGLPWERALMQRIHTPLPPLVDALMLVFPWFGTNITLIPGVVLIGWWLWVKKGQPHLAMRLAIVQLGSYVLNPLLKELFGRTRPDMYPLRGWFGWSSYPSGHAIASISVLMTLAIILRRVNGWRWPFFVIIPVMLASLYSRTYLGVHWPTDVIGGALVGAVWLAATMYAFRNGDTHARPPSS